LLSLYKGCIGATGRDLESLGAGVSDRGVWPGVGRLGERLRDGGQHPEGRDSCGLVVRYDD
jgi:hypothetical protein